MQFVQDLFYFPRIGKGIFRVWMRNFTYFKYTIWVSIFWVFIEPILYLLGIGYGLGAFVNGVDGQSYIHFFTPALMSISAMFVAYFESTYASYTKLAVQKTFNSILLTPVTAAEIAVGEILWASFKSFLSVLGVTVVAVALGLLDITYLFPALVVLFLTGWLFASFGLLLASYAKNYDWFIYGQSGIIIPMSLFSGTYFPLSELPSYLQPVAYSLPLTHTILAVRSLLSGQIEPSIFINIAVLFVFALMFSNLAIAKLSRRITG